MRKKIITIVIVVLFVGIIAKDKIIEISAEKMCSFVTGAKLDIGSMKVGIVRPVISIKNMKLYNPEGFPKGVLTDIPLIYVKYKPFALLKKDIHIQKLDFYLKELNVVKNQEGHLNLNALKPVKTHTEGAKLEKEEQGKVPDIDIKELHLKADRVNYTDYTAKGSPGKYTFDVNVDEKFEDIRDPYTLVRLIIARVLANTFVSNMVKMPMKEVGVVVQDAYQAGTVVVEGAMEEASGAAGQIGGTLTGAAKELGGALTGGFFRGRSETPEEDGEK